MVFFGDFDRDLVGKPADVFLAKNYGLVSTVLTEIYGLTSRSYVVYVTVLRYSFHTMDICFQALKFYPEGSSIFIGHNVALVAAGKSVESLPASLGGAMEQGSGSVLLARKSRPLSLLRLLMLLHSRRHLLFIWSVLIQRNSVLHTLLLLGSLNHVCFMELLIRSLLVET